MSKESGQEKEKRARAEANSATQLDQPCSASTAISKVESTLNHDFETNTTVSTAASACSQDRSTASGNEDEVMDSLQERYCISLSK